MARIKVKAVQGRIAREAPDGPLIPYDRYVSVEDTKYIRRLLDVHGDITLEPKPKVAPPRPVAAAAPEAKPFTPAPTKKE